MNMYQFDTTNIEPFAEHVRPKYNTNWHMEKTKLAAELLFDS